ncbi:MAG TPA: BTAD domain-containing putative transcriptional regulator [Streptosporangiaceae bacterium]|nr:BTAD domain-containing putative transcriptional regulator [Streptosporangiaceae bacterium]
MSIRVGILGPLEVRDAAGRPVPVGGTRLRSLLIRLAISDGHPVPVDRLAADLWPGEGPADAANAVQALVSRLRGAAGKDLVEYGPTGYRLTLPSEEIDAWAFERLVAAARARLAGGGSSSADRAADAAGAAEAAGVPEAADLFREALRLWRGPALADVADAPFAAGTIARLSELRLAATEDRIDADLALGRGAELVPEVEELATEHPLRERLRGQLMRALYAAGRQADALGVFEDTRRALADALGVDPSPALSAVHLAILRAEETGPPPRPAPPTRNAPPPQPAPGNAARRLGNLPAQLTSFVGRDEELDRIGRLLTQHRLITLTGPGGAGKTRLSLEVGARIIDRAPDGVWFVPLAPVRDGADVAQAVLTAIGAHEIALPPDAVEAARLAAMEPLERLGEVLAARSLVLILDNCEHVLDAVAWLSGQVLADAPGVRVLATSREPLGLTGETLCPVPSLPLPSPDAGPAQAGASPAVRLFADRAAAVRPGFCIEAGTAEPVVRICRALDGIPLAIELAAARVRTLTPAQVADRLDDRFALLSVGTRGALPRHQTLRAIVDWSWELLDDTERMVLRRLSVFSGGATPDAAEQVCSLDGKPAPAAVVEVIASLVDKSLVTATGERQVRYGLLETVRAYATGRLEESGETRQAADAHARYFLELAERAEPLLRTRDQVTWLDRLSADHDNLSAALRHAIAVGDAAAALRFIRSLVWFWIVRDFDTEASESAAAVLRLAGDTPPEGLADAHAVTTIVAALAKATADGAGDMRPMLDALGRLSLPPDTEHPLLAVAGPIMRVFSGDSEGARKQLLAGPPHRDPWVRATQRSLAGHFALNEGDIESGARDLADAYDAFQELGDRFGLIGCLTGLAEVAAARGRPDEAVRMLEQAREHAAGLGGNLAGIMGIALGEARARAGDIERARADLEEGVRTAERAGELDDMASGYVQLSDVARRVGDLTGAREQLRRALDIVEPRLARPDMFAVGATAFSKLGCVAEQEGDLAAAATWHQRAIGVLAEGPAATLPSNRTLASAVDGIAALAVARGEPARAAELLGLAHRLQGFSDASSLEVIRAKAAITARLSEADFRAAYERGQRLGRADALALRVTPAAGTAAAPAGTPPP